MITKSLRQEIISPLISLSCLVISQAPGHQQNLSSFFSHFRVFSEWFIALCTVLCLVTQLWPTLCDTMNGSCQAPLPMGILQARILDWVAMPSSRGCPNPRIKPRSPTIQANSLPSEPPGKPKDTGVGSLSFLQGIFPTQELNLGLLHCRWILYQLLPGSHLIYWVLSCFSQVRLFMIPWIVARQALLSMGFPRQKYWSGLPFPSPGELPDPGIEPGSPALQVDSLPSESPGNILPA